MKKIRIISFTEKGYDLAGQLCSAFSLRGDDAERCRCGAGSSVRLKEWTAEHFRSGSVLLFIGACGIAVRSVAPHLMGKTEDPAVLVMDEAGRFCISLLSGHLGEANRYAEIAAGFTGGTAVLTTATDVNGLPAVDVLAAENDMTISSMEGAKRFSAALLRDGRGRILIPEQYADVLRPEGEVPAAVSLETAKSRESGELRPEGAGSQGGGAAERAVCVISPERLDGGMLQLIPRCLILGVGCRKDKDPAMLHAFAERVLREKGLRPEAVRCVASIDLKKEEPALLSLAREWKVPFCTFSAERLMQQEGNFDSSEFVRRITGADNVCERAAMAAGASRLIVPKQAEDGVTCAVGAALTAFRFRRKERTEDA